MQFLQRFRFKSGRSRSMFLVMGAIAVWLTLTIGYSNFGIAAPWAKNQPLHHGTGNFTFVDQQGNPNKLIEVWYYQPPNLPATAPIVFVMTGIKRNARDYRDGWIQYAKQSHFLLVVPEFSKLDYPTNYQYNYGNLIDKETGKVLPEEQWTFSAIEHLFDYVKEITNNQSSQYRIYGHSAGGQFVHRMLLFKTNARIQRAIAANPGAYAMLDFQTEFPYGLKDTNLTPETLQTAFGKEFVLLLGDQDVKTDDPVLNESPQAMLQGENRFGRGLHFYSSVVQNDEAVRQGTEFRWQLGIVHGAGHDETKMATAAANRLFADD